jgi:hypothetical protein
VERYTIEVRDEAVSTLRNAAEAKGVTVESELGALVDRAVGLRASDDWVHELIALTRPGVADFMPNRWSWERPIPFEYDDFG